MHPTGPAVQRHALGSDLAKPWEGLQMTCQGLKPDSGNLTVRHYRGSRETNEAVNPPAIERAGMETPHLHSEARPISIPTGYSNSSLILSPEVPCDWIGKEIKLS